MGTEREGSQESSFYSEINRLVSESITGSRSVAARAHDTLIAGIQNDPFYDSTVIATDLSLQLVTRENRTGVLNKGLDLIEEILHEGGGGKVGVGDTITLNIDDSRVMSTIDNIMRNHETLNPLFRKYLPGGYIYLAEDILPRIKSNQAKGADKFQLLITSAKDDIENPKQLLDKLSEWNGNFVNLINNGDLGDPKMKDDLVDLLKSEPDTSEITGRAPLFKRQFASVSLEDISHMPYPLSDEDNARISDFVIAAYQSQDLNKPEMGAHKKALGELFLYPQRLQGISEPILLRNKQIFLIINTWQEDLVNSLLLDIKTPTSEKSRTIVEAIDSYGAMLLLDAIFARPVRPIIYDPEYNFYNYLERIQAHEIAREALESLSKDTIKFSYFDTTLANYLKDKLLPAFEQKIARYGLTEKFSPYISEYKKGIEPERMAKSRAEEVKERFNALVGAEFLEKMNEYTESISRITQITWQDMLDKGMHYLPLKQGVDIILFSRDSFPEIMGLNQIDLTQVGDPQDWKIDVSLAFKGGGIAALGTLDQNGKLTMLDPIGETAPALDLLFNHIAVLTFHDLSIQQRTESPGFKNKGRGKTPQSPEILSLPRIHRDRDIIRDVFSITDYPPRRVELHKMRLKGYKQYKAVVFAYLEAVNSNQPYEIILRRRDELEAVRENSRKASPEKVKNVPARFKLEAVKDPVTEEVRHLETWVVEHTSPKPNEEELKDPVKLFERYYKNSSTLASLDQLKPWIVGEE